MSKVLSSNLSQKKPNLKNANTAKKILIPQRGHNLSPSFKSCEAPIAHDKTKVNI